MTAPKRAFGGLIFVAKRGAVGLNSDSDTVTVMYRYVFWSGLSS
jgi:hypothetical protein